MKGYCGWCRWMLLVGCLLVVLGHTNGVHGIHAEQQQQQEQQRPGQPDTWSMTRASTSLSPSPGRLSVLDHPSCLKETGGPRDNSHDPHPHPHRAARMLQFENYLDADDSEEETGSSAPSTPMDVYDNPFRAAFDCSPSQRWHIVSPYDQDGYIEEDVQEEEQPARGRLPSIRALTFFRDHTRVCAAMVSQLGRALRQDSWSFVRHGVGVMWTRPTVTALHGITKFCFLAQQGMGQVGKAAALHRAYLQHHTEYDTMSLPSDNNDDEAVDVYEDHEGIVRVERSADAHPADRQPLVDSRHLAASRSLVGLSRAELRDEGYQYPRVHFTPDLGRSAVMYQNDWDPSDEEEVSDPDDENSSQNNSDNEDDHALLAIRMSTSKHFNSNNNMMRSPDRSYHQPEEDGRAMRMHNAIASPHQNLRRRHAISLEA